jgi:hypothetical protein
MVLRYLRDHSGVESVGGVSEHTDSLLRIRVGVVMSASMSSCNCQKAFLQVYDHLPSKDTEVAFFLVLPLASFYTTSSRSCGGAAFSANRGRLLRIQFNAATYCTR